MVKTRCQRQIIQPWFSLFLIIPLLFTGSGRGIRMPGATTAARGASAPPAAPMISPEDDFLAGLAEDTWFYLHSDLSISHQLPGSWRREGSREGDYDNPTEIGLYALSWLAAYDLGRTWSPTWAQTEGEVTAILDQLRAWQTGSQTYQPNGPNAWQNKVFFQWYHIGEELEKPVVGPNKEKTNNQLVPSVDNAWLAACLMTIRAYALDNNHLEMAKLAGDILADMDFMLWYHPDRHLFTWGAVHDPQDEQNHWFADTYSDENRIINFVARALGQMDAGEFCRSLQAMHQPAGTYDDITVGKIGWDGSYFAYAAPGLFIHQQITDYETNTIEPATLAQMRYAENQGYAAWGFSDCYGVKMDPYWQAGAPPSRNSGNEEKPGLAAPFAAALALNTKYRPQAITQLQAFKTNYPCLYSATYGFHESVMTKTGDPKYGRCSYRYSALAQEWMFLSLVNDQNGFIWRYFYRDPRVPQTHDEMFACQVGSHFLPVIGK